ncbi:hypothetical protein PV327_003211 [Microctonus hyperodae]|uniref:Cytochrome c oxidase subunit 4 n=1 Tax=Microctonus hyperodae TaxID=165561 RepID=A0AA39G419_MICHY|nr:hypothetical protein PV327_003211 [Microctonus hyperodae]
MAGRLLLSYLKNSNRLSIRSYSHLQGPPINFKYGNREIVGFGMNGEPAYLDLEDFPMPAIRFKETTPDIQILKDKEKGDWKKLSIEDKKALYRASFRQTFAELNAPTGEWKSITGSVFFGLGIALWMYMFCRHYICPPLPDTFREEEQLAQLERMKLLNMNPIWGLNSKST